MKKLFVIGIVLIVSLLVISQSVLLYSAISLQRISGEATGTTALCINAPPIINNTCNSSVSQSVAFNCLVDANDPNNDTLMFNSSFVNETGFFNITSWGLIAFTAQDSDVGNHTVNITVMDSAACGNNQDSTLWPIEITEANDAPILLQSIPDETVVKGGSVSFSLLSYYVDPDGDPLNFTVTTTTYLTISIFFDQVTITANKDCTGTVYDSFIFRATDPYGLYRDSNIVTYEIVCTQNTGGSGTGTGGGGGGGSSRDCKPKWVCGPWGRCTENGTQTRICADLAACEGPSKEFTQECKYYAHCFDGKKNFDETGIDCGGVDCDPCASCTDGIQNQGELGVDCGGPCTKCQHCTNGYIDFDEEGIDCGGEECPACATCGDGIQNQGETGVDCGGPCAPCSVVEVPEPVRPELPFYVQLLLIFVAALTIALIVYRFYRKPLRRFFARLLTKYFPSGNREVLLSEEDAERVADQIKHLLKVLGTKKEINRKTIALFTTVLRTYLSSALQLRQIFNAQELHEAFAKKKVSKALLGLLKDLGDTLYYFERLGDKTVPKTRFLVFIESFKTLYANTIPDPKVMKELHDPLPTSQDEKEAFLLFIAKTYKALQFSKTVIARANYLALLDDYNKLPEKQQSEFYPLLQGLFFSLRYAQGRKK